MTLVSWVIWDVYRLNGSVYLLCFIMITTIASLGLLIQVLSSEDEELKHEYTSLDSVFIKKMLLKHLVHFVWTIIATLLYVTTTLENQQELIFNRFLLTNLWVITTWSHEWIDYDIKDQNFSCYSISLGFLYFWSIFGAINDIVFGATN